MSKKKKILAGVALIATSITTYYVIQGYRYVRSDNAQVDARTLALSTKVGGYVEKVMVDVGDVVTAGTIVAKLDDRDFKNNLVRAIAERESVDARLQDAQRTYRRLAELTAKGAATQAQLDAATAIFNELKARQAAAVAQVALAELNLSYCEIKAPFDGFIARRSVQPGQLLSPGTPVFGFVDSEERWITANLKETELKGLATGAEVDIDVDSIPGKSFSGTLAQFSPVTGATFALIPPDNATGNFTKVVQRIPVKIKLNSLSQEDRKALRVGLSAEVKIHRQ